LYGSAAALLSLFLYTWDPNIIAHSQLVTTDVYALGTIALSMYCLWRFSQQRDWKRLLAFALALGVSQLAKYTAVFLYPLAVLLLLVRDSPDLVRWLFSRQWGHLGRYAIHSLVWTGVTLALSLVIINAGFLFHRSLMQLGEIHFKSEFFLSAQSRLVIFKDVRLPVPQPFLRGLDLVRYRERSGRGYAKIYLFGQFRKEGFPGYYLIASLFKVPIAELLLSLVASIVYFWKRSFHRFLENELFLWGPVLFFTLYFNFFYRAQIGIRFFLVVFPFIQIFSGSLLKDWASIRPRLKWAIGILAVYMLLSVLSYYPNFIPYFNELVIDRRFAYRVLADSNLDWGQGSKAVSEYQNVHPGALINPDSPVAGTVVVSANNLVGITAEPLTYRWLRENFRPVTTVAYSHLVYQISEQDLLRLGIVPP
jgi:4-amino-4-deoxy-L-arabinose transferase-like glycosyltransferase